MHIYITHMIVVDVEFFQERAIFFFLRKKSRLLLFYLNFFFGYIISIGNAYI